MIPRGRWIGFSHQIIHHGRQVCTAQPEVQHVQPGDAVPVERQDVGELEGRVAGLAQLPVLS